MPPAVPKRRGTDRPRRSDLNINFRVTSQDKQIIATAARLTGKTATQFILDSTRQAAVDAILDQTVFHVDGKAWAEFQSILDAPSTPKPNLGALMAKRPPWEG